MIKVKNCWVGVKQQSLTHSYYILIFSYTNITVLTETLLGWFSFFILFAVFLSFGKSKWPLDLFLLVKISNALSQNTCHVCRNCNLVVMFLLWPSRKFEISCACVRACVRACMRACVGGWGRGVRACSRNIGQDPSWSWSYGSWI